MTSDDPAAGKTDVFTDGACSGNPGPGGWAWATRDGRHGSGGDPSTTNQRMELQAVLEALRALRGEVVVHSDSTYVVNCFNESWYEGWLARDWRTSQRKPVANRDIWQPLIELYLDRPGEITFVWVKGHSGDEMNDLVDRLAVAEATALKEGRAKAEAGEPVAGPQPPWPIDRAVAVTGVGELDDDRNEELELAVDGLDPAQDILVSGLRRGTELTAAERALVLQVPLAVVLPFADPASRWPRPDRERFERAVDAASWVVTLEGDPATPATAVAARNRWIWEAVVGAIVIGDPALADQLEEAGLGVVG
ncbi:MAG: RNase H family protein [Actinomycetota bacterium]